MKMCLKSFAVLMLLTCSVAYAIPQLPALHIDTFKGTPGDHLWRNMFGAMTRGVHGVWEKHGSGPMPDPGTREEICLRNHYSRWFLDQTGHHMRGGDYNQAAVAFIKKVLRDNEKQPCDPRDGKPNAGLEAFKKFEADVSRKTTSFESELRTLLDDLKRRGNDLTVAQFAAIVGAALGGALILSPI